MKRILLASVAALGLAGTASAADLAVKAPPLVPVFTWTGCYLGANAGYIASREKYTTNRATFVDPVRVPLSANNLLTHSYKGNGSSGEAGGQFGCQYQWGSWVLGGEWDFQWSGLKENNVFNFPAITDPATGFTWPPRNEFVHKQLDWFSTARARLGYAIWDRVLLYGTAGLAVGALDSFTQVFFLNPAGQNCSLAAVPCAEGAYRKERLGWTAGGGVEWAFANNWTVKAEFLYLDFGSFDYISPVNTFAAADQRMWVTHIKAQDYAARIGLNYLFHLGPAAPVVAAY